MPSVSCTIVSPSGRAMCAAILGLAHDLILGGSELSDCWPRSISSPPLLERNWIHVQSALKKTNFSACKMAKLCWRLTGVCVSPSKLTYGQTSVFYFSGSGSFRCLVVIVVCARGGLVAIPGTEWPRKFPRCDPTHGLE